MHDRPADALDRRGAVRMMGGLIGAAGLPRPAVAAATGLNPGELVSVAHFGAVPDGHTDSTAAFDAAIEHAAAQGRPIWIPAGSASYRIARTIHPRTGLVGEGRGSAIQALDAAGFADGSPLVRIGWTRRESVALCTVPVQGFRVIGMGTRPRVNGVDPRRMGFEGSGILYDESAAFIHAFDIGADFCLRGIVHNGTNGHIGGTAVHCSNNWYNLYWQRNTGDYRYFDSLFAGAVFASYGCHGSDRGDGDVGGISGLTTIGCHAGYSPYIFFQEDGNGTVGLNGWTAINSSCEQVGNQVIRVGRTMPGKHRNCAGWHLVATGHTWTVPGTPEHTAYSIAGMAAPQQERAIDLDLVQGPPLVIQGDSFTPGSSGEHTRIRDLLAWVRDDNGIGGYEVVRQGAERLVYSSAPVLRQTRDVQAGPGRGAAPTTVDFDVSAAYDNTPTAEIRWALVHDDPGPAGVAMTVTAAVLGRGSEREQTGPVQYLRAGRGNVVGSFRIQLGRRDRAAGRHRVRIVLSSDGPAALRITGTIELVVAQDSGIVG